MGRTFRSERPAGSEYWKSRLHRHGETPGGTTKDLTHSKERAKDHRICHKIKQQLNDDDFDEDFLP